MNTNQSVDKIYFGVIDSSAAMEIQIKSIEIQESDIEHVSTQDSSMAMPMQTNTTNKIRFTFDCPTDDQESVNLMLHEEGWLHLSKDLPPLKGFFYDFKTFHSPYDWKVDAILYFKGSYEYIEYTAKELKRTEPKAKETKRRITFI